jgi:polyvinyl alcohol dehydrogenase (cytochrome)
VAGAQGPDAAGLFARACSSCHTGAADTRAPDLTTLQSRTPESIIEALVTGAMRVQGSRLSGAERRALAEFITHKKLAGDATGAATGRCASDATWSVADKRPRWAGWSTDAANTRFQTADQARLTAADLSGLTLK